MHDTAFQMAAHFFSVYGAGARSVLDVGSYDLNGSMRDVRPPGVLDYIGVDWAEGPGVDRVASGEEGAGLPVLDEEFDLALTSSALEHDPCFWETFVELVRSVRLGGYVYLNVPSNGKYHAHPLDCWRFYPDAGEALARWARRRGYDCTLVESFVLDRQEAEWNDTVCVFRRGPAELGPRIYERCEGARNVRDPLASPELLRYSEQTEDQRLYQVTLAKNLAEQGPLLSVIVAYYQGCTSDAEFERFLGSLRRQEMRDFEVLIYHDGPLLHPVACEYPIYESDQHRGLWGHDLREHGRLQAKGRYQLYTNADNVYAPEAFLQIAHVIEKYGMQLLVCQVDMVGMWADEKKALHYDTPRDPSKVHRLTGDPVRRNNVDLMQLVIGRDIARQYAWGQEIEQEDGVLYEQICREHSHVKSTILIGTHY